eukprot:327238-Chlamydomonas_euryale.AAC.1
MQHMWGCPIGTAHAAPARATQTCLGMYPFHASPPHAPCPVESKYARWVPIHSPKCLDSKCNKWGPHSRTHMCGQQVRQVLETLMQRKDLSEAQSQEALS